MTNKSSVDEIRRRFDADVARFSNLATGQTATVDAPLVLELMTEAAAASTPDARDLLDVGCGAGNYTLKMLQRLPGLNVTLVDLSRPMLDAAKERLAPVLLGGLTTHQTDIRNLPLPPAGYDIILAAAVLHHLRSFNEWHAVFATFFKVLRPGGSLWISDLVTHAIDPVQAMMWRRYGDYLVGLKDEAYRDRVFAYIEKEDTPAPLGFQLDLLRKVGFDQVDVLHKNGPFAAFGAVKPKP